MSQQQIAKDLGRKITDKIERDLQREIDLAQAVLDSHGITILMMDIAARVQVAAVLIAMQSRKGGVDPAQIFDVFAGLISAHALALKPQAIATIAQIEAERRA